MDLGHLKLSLGFRCRVWGSKFNVCGLGTLAVQQKALMRSTVRPSGSIRAHIGTGRKPSSFEA